jgi:hypothetical protein
VLESVCWQQERIDLWLRLLQNFESSLSMD